MIELHHLRALYEKQSAGTPPHDISRFVAAQGDGNYEQALSEIRNGRKRSHWIWYVFPQIIGLGHSYMAQTYAIQSIDEAREFLSHPLLRSRLEEITEALLQHTDKSASEIFGSLDALKVRSCMTLFDIVSPHGIFENVLDTFYGGSRCELTVEILEGV